MTPAVKAMKDRRRVERPVAEPEEAISIGEAAQALTAAIKAGQSAENCAYETVTSWICARSRLHAEARVASPLILDLGPSRTRGLVEAALPTIGEAIGALVPPDVAFFDLDRETVITVLATAVSAVRAIEVEPIKHGVSTALNDPIPFGSP